MFSDLVGSTALSARMDPEDLREVISAYHKCAAETVRRFGGFVAKYMGDGVLGYFGYPQAHEGDPERAVRAGLELVAAVGDLKTHAALQRIFSKIVAVNFASEHCFSLAVPSWTSICNVAVGRRRFCSRRLGEK